MAKVILNKKQLTRLVTESIERYGVGVKHDPVITLRESQLRRVLEAAANGEELEEGGLSNLASAFGKGISNMYGKGGGLRDAWNAGKEEFGRLQAQDDDINQYNKMTKKANKYANKRDSQKDKIEQVEQWRQEKIDSINATADARIARLQGKFDAYASEYGNTNREKSKVAREMGKERWGAAKKAGDSGKNASQVDRDKRRAAARKAS